MGSFLHEVCKSSKSTFALDQVASASLFSRLVTDELTILIFDRQFSHFVFELKSVLYVPSEAVYACFEMKQNINKDHIDYAGRKVRSVRDLKRTSKKFPQIDGSLKRKKPARILGGLIALTSDYRQPLGDQVKKQLSNLKSGSKLDFVFSLEHGLFGTDQPSGLAVFLYELLSSLQQMGNPPAIDYKSYLQNFRSQQES